jgi:peptidoglycan/LPS O-acetylase OafA/YrhL
MKALLFLLILPNVAGTLYPPVLYLSHSWSIGTEEQFYIVWPVLMRWFRRRRLQLFAAVFLGYLLVNYALLAWARATGSPAAVLSYGFWGLFNINCMALGAMAAYWAFVDSRRILRVLRHRATELGASATAVVLMAIGVHFPHLHNELYAVLFAVVILNAATNPRTLWRLENPVLDYLGKISYGLYMYHPLAIVIVIRSAQHWGLESRIVSLGGAVLLTTAMASASYELFERRFLKLKARFSAIVSGDDARRVRRAERHA